MSEKKLSLGVGVAVLFFVAMLAIFVGADLFDDTASAECPDDNEFTTDFRLEDCGYFKTIGMNPYFILKPCYQLVLETPEGADEPERAVVTVLRDIKWLNLGDRWVRTRVVEERAYELEVNEEGEVEETLIEISRNWFAICKKTNAVYYFGEDSRDCEDGFADNEEECEDGSTPDDTGSWRAVVNDAMPGLIMPGTFLLGSRYFQEQGPPDAVDRGENWAMGLTAPDPEGGPDFTGCVMVVETNPAETVCEPDEENSKTYCPGVGLVQDEGLVLVEYGFVDCNDDDEHKGKYPWRWTRHRR
jgi:hypothetical protein